MSKSIGTNEKEKQVYVYTHILSPVFQKQVYVYTHILSHVLPYARMTVMILRTLSQTTRFLTTTMGVKCSRVEDSH